MNPLRSFVLGVLVAACALTAGCFEKRFVWSPDGERALVITTSGLYLTDAAGHLSGLQVADVNVAMWLPDSRRLVMGRHGDMLFGELVGDHIVIRATQAAGVKTILELRISPDARFVAAFCSVDRGADSSVAEFVGSDELGGPMLVATTDGKSKPVVVARYASGIPDWTPDSRSLVYPDHGSTREKDQAGVIRVVARRIVNEAGEFDLTGNPELLALGFGELMRVHCLRDGRVLFDSTEVTLPASSRDAVVEQEQFFIVDPAGRSVTRPVPRDEAAKLPRLLFYYDLSPDEKHISVCGTDAKVCVVDFASGAVDTIQDASTGGVTGVPVWRNNEEFVFARTDPPAGDGKRPKRKAEVVIHPRVGEDRTLSGAWPDEFMDDFMN